MKYSLFFEFFLFLLNSRSIPTCLVSFPLEICWDDLWVNPFEFTLDSILTQFYSIPVISWSSLHFLEFEHCWNSEGSHQSELAVGKLHCFQNFRGQTFFEHWAFAQLPLPWIRHCLNISEIDCPKILKYFSQASLMETFICAKF